MSILWISLLAPPYDGKVGRLVLTRRGEGETVAQVGVRCGLLAFPDIPLPLLSIQGYELAEDMIIPDTMLDRPLDGLDVAAAQRIVADQVPKNLKPN